MRAGTSGVRPTPRTPNRSTRRRRKTPRLTLSNAKRKRKSKNCVEADIFAEEDVENSLVRRELDLKPRSWAEWQTMPPWESFRLGGECFKKGDSALVRWGEGDDNVWLVQILKIRARSKTEKVTPWVLVHWYYSAAHLVAEYGSDHRLYLDDLHLSLNERVASDRLDILSGHVFDKVVNVIQWHEGENPVPVITENSYFIRTNFSWTHTDWAIAPGNFTCMGHCNRLYDPYLPSKLFNVSKMTLFRHFQENEGVKEPPSGMVLDADNMHFCSRPSCRRWYHRACLLHNRQYVEEPTSYIPGSRDIRRIALDPCVEAQDIDSNLQRYTYPMSVCTSGKMSSTTLTGLSIYDLLKRDFKISDRLPASVARVAVRPIVRWANMPEGRRLAGYMEEILLAQNLVHQELQFSLEEFDRHMEEVLKDHGPEWEKEPRVIEYVKDMLMRYRLLASPLPRYWEQLEDEIERVYGGGDLPPLLCANCFGAI